jgi:hypothetical protein
MLFPALGMTAAAWLMTVPLFGLETGFRAELSVVTGILALPLALGSLWSFRAGIGLAALAMILCLVDFTVSAPIGSVANYATCCAALAIAGMAPRPVSTTVTATVTAADDLPTAPTRVAPERAMVSDSLAA